MRRRLVVHVAQDLAVVYAWYFGVLAARYVASRYAARRALQFNVDPSLVGRVLTEMFD